MDGVSLEIKNSSGNSQELAQLVASEAQKMLGGWLVLDNNNRKQVKDTRKQIVAWEEKLRTGVVDRRDEWQALTLTIMKQMEVPIDGINTYR